MVQLKHKNVVFRENKSLRSRMPHTKFVKNEKMNIIKLNLIKFNYI